MADRSIFLEVSSLTADRAVSILEDIRSQHRANAPNDRVFNLVLTNIADLDGNLYTEILDIIRPYLPGGSLVACDNVFIGTRWLPWQWAQYGADPNKWYNHYAVWGGILFSQYRWDNIFYSRKVWKAFKERYDLPWMHFYISMEADLAAFHHSELGHQIRLAYEATIIELCKEAKAVEPNRSVMWSPFHWTPFRQTSVAERSRLADELVPFFNNVKNYSGMGINFLNLQDSVGARPGIVHKEDAFECIRLVAASHPFASVRMNVEWFKLDANGIVPQNAFDRENWYVGQGYKVDAIWEGRWWKDAHSHSGTPTPTPFPKIKFLTREQWGARTDIPRLGFYVPPTSRTELHIHNTAAIDGNDSTPNRWTEAEAIRYMKILQTVRPDLGFDVSYTWVFFVMENLDVLICEGRGLLRSGAHTAGHNTAGFGWGVGGNFDLSDGDAGDAFLKVVQNEAKYLRANGFPNLCNVKNPKGWDMWGHRDTAPKSCPGNTLYPKLATVKVVE